MISIGEKLKMLRHQRKVTQAKVSDAIGISVQALSRYENDRAEPDIEVLSRLALYYQVDINYLYGYTHYPKEIDEYVMVNGDTNLLSKYHMCSKDFQRLIRKMVDESYKIQLEKMLKNGKNTGMDEPILMVCEEDLD